MDRGERVLEHVLATVVALTLASAVVVGQEPQTGVQAAKPADKPVAAQPARPPAQLVNVRLELTITEQRGNSPLPAKTVTMLVADREFGRVRAAQGNTTLNVDGRPEVLGNGRIRVTLSLEYRRPQDETDKTSPALLTQSVATILEDGKPLMVSQSADPGSTANVRLDVKATISK